MGIDKLVNDAIEHMENCKCKLCVRVIAVLQSAVDAAKEEQRETDAKTVERLVDLTRSEVAKVIRDGGVK